MWWGNSLAGSNPALSVAAPSVGAPPFVFSAEFIAGSGATLYVRGSTPPEQMPNVGVFHPQVVHFVIALCLVGVGLRVVSLLRKWPWMNPAATALILLGTLASVVAVKSGADAHGPAERVPGARNAVVEHEEWGERARNIFLLIAAVELVALAMAEKNRRLLHMASAVVGLGGVFAMYETGEHGGELVYSYAGGVGIRSGEPADVERLLMAGLYHQAMLDRREKRGEAAGALFEQMGRLRPADFSVQLLAVESLLRDRNDVASARQAVESLNAPDERSKRSQALLKVDILATAGHRDSARAILEPVIAALPAPNARLQAKLDSLK